MRGVLIITEDQRETTADESALVRAGYATHSSTSDDEAECDLKETLFLVLASESTALDMDIAGIDDFLFPSYSPAELLARLRLALRRARSIGDDHVIRIRDVAIDLQNYRVSTDGIPVQMTFREYELFKFLATHRRRVFTREALLNHVWGYDYYGGTRTVDVHIRRIRSKLGHSSEDLIETVRNVGYRFSG